MDVHDFKKDLTYSELNFEERKGIYEEKFSFRNIKFVAYDTEENKKLQHHDVDVTAEDVQGKKYKISEKIRKYKYPGDVLVEVWSGFEDKIKGWLSDSVADYLTLFYDDRALCVNAQELKQFCKKFFTRPVVNTINKEFAYLIEQDKKGKSSIINGVKVFLTAAKNKRENGTVYHTMSVCFPEKYLIKQGVKIIEI